MSFSRSISGNSDDFYYFNNNESNEDVKIQTKASTLNYIFFHYNNDIINHICSFLEWKDHYNFIIHDGYLKEKIVCDAINLKKLKDKLFSKRLSMKKLIDIFDMNDNRMIYKNIDTNYYMSTNVSPCLEPIYNVYETDRFDLNDTKDNDPTSLFNLNNSGLAYSPDNINTMDSFFKNIRKNPSIDYKIYDDDSLYNFKIEDQFNSLLFIIRKIFDHTRDVKNKLKVLYHIKEITKIDPKINTSFNGSNYINDYIKSLKYCYSYEYIFHSLSEISIINTNSYSYNMRDKILVKFIKSVVENPLIKSDDLTKLMIYIKNNKEHILSRNHNYDINNCLITLYNHPNNTEDNYHSYIKQYTNQFKLRDIINLNLLNNNNNYYELVLNKCLINIENIFSACYNNKIFFKNVLSILDIYTFLFNKKISLRLRYLITYCFQPSINNFHNIYEIQNYNDDEKNINLKIILDKLFFDDKYYRENGINYLISQIGEDNLNKNYTKDDDVLWNNFFIDEMKKHIYDDYKETINNLNYYKNIYNYFVLLNNYIYDTDINGNFLFRDKIAPHLLTNIQSYLRRIDTTDIKTEDTIFFFVDAVSKLLTYVDDKHIMILLKYAIITYSNIIKNDSNLVNNYTEKYIQDLLMKYCRKTVDNLFIEYLSIDIDSITINKGKTFNFIKWFNSIDFNDERIKLHYMKYSDEYGNNLYKNTSYHNLINSTL